MATREIEDLVKSLFSQIDKLNKEVKALTRENKRLRESDDIQVIESTPKRIKREADQHWKHWIVSSYCRTVLGKKLTLRESQDIGGITALLYRAYYRYRDSKANLLRSSNAPLTKSFLPKVMGPSGEQAQQYEDSDCHLIKKAYTIFMDHNKTPKQLLDLFIDIDWHEIDKILEGQVTPALLEWK